MGYVLITGASSGIGYELAKQFAMHGESLIISATNLQRLESVKKELEEQFFVDVVVVAEDLSQKGAATELYRKIKEQNLTVSVLINNAGFGCVGEFVDIPLSFEESMMMVNMVNLVGLTKLFLSEMKDSGAGKILNVASTGAFQPGPWIASYYATKAFVFNFSEAIRMEYKKYGVKISTLCPGATKTNFTKRAGKGQMKHAMEASKVAEIAYRKFNRNKKIIIPGIMNRLGQVPPRWLRSLFVEKLQKRLARN